MSNADKCILILGCFDTKGEVFAYLRQSIIDNGQKVITINTGVYNEGVNFPIDYSADEVARQAGVDITQLRKDADRGKAMDVMSKGASNIIKSLVDINAIKGAIGMGGGGGTYMTLYAMQQIPLGIPKICVSTVATKDLSRQIGHKDIILIPSIVDVAGMNGVIQEVIEQAAAAICAMSNIIKTKKSIDRKRIAISMFGNTTACVNQCTDLLSKEGYEVLAFHATGVGGKAMEALIREGVFDAVLDVTTTELADELCGGICSAGDTRLDAAAEMGLPQVIVPGCLDMVNFAHLDTLPEKYQNRHLYSWAPDVTLLRTNEEENEQLGLILSLKVNQSKASSVVVLPLKGISQIDAEGNIFYNPGANQALFNSIKENLNDQIELLEIDAHINDLAFSEILVKSLLGLLEK